MGILSEIDMMNRDAEDDAFEVSSDSETVDSFSEEFEPVEPPKPDPQAEDAEEARKKAEFDAAEAKRKAEWEAKQAQKKLREQQELDRLAAMSDDDVMQASMNRVSQDTERLTRRNMKLCVMEDVQTECLADPAFARLVMNPKKKMLNCFHYINRKAREYLEQEMKDNDEKPMGGGFGGDVPDELCYQWAREYFRDAEAKEDAEPEEKFVPKTYNGKMPKAGKVKKDKPKKAAPKPARDWSDYLPAGSGAAAQAGRIGTECHPSAAAAAAPSAGAAGGAGQPPAAGTAASGRKRCVYRASAAGAASSGRERRVCGASAARAAESPRQWLVPASSGWKRRVCGASAGRTSARGRWLPGASAGRHGPSGWRGHESPEAGCAGYGARNGQGARLQLRPEQEELRPSA